MRHQFSSGAVADAFDRFEETTRPTLLALRDLVFAIAAEDHRIGTITEDLRWGQPAYLTLASKSGTTLRLGEAKPLCPALFVHCRTTLVSDFKAAFPGRADTQGTRAILVATEDAVDPMRHGWLIRRALTYHL